MGLFDFIKNVGKKISGGPSGEDIEKDIKQRLGRSVDNLRVRFEDGTVQLSGSVPTEVARQKAVLIAGNVEGVERVNDDFLDVEEEESDAPTTATNYTFYTIESGDSLSKIAKEYYGDANKWNTLFEANREVIEDPDLIYPGQQIRVPANPNA